MDNAASSSLSWWTARLLRYNIALIVAGGVAFIAYLIVGFGLLPDEMEFEATLFTTLSQGIGYLLMMAMANVCYWIGPLSERTIRPKNPEQYRRVTWRLGLWFSVALPLGIPVLLAMQAFF